MYSFEGVPERLATETSPEAIFLFRGEFTCASRLAPTININANVTAVVHRRLRQIETRAAFVLDSCFLDIASPLKTHNDSPNRGNSRFRLTHRIRGIVFYTLDPT